MDAPIDKAEQKRLQRNAAVARSKKLAKEGKCIVGVALDRDLVQTVGDVRGCGDLLAPIATRHLLSLSADQLPSSDLRRIERGLVKMERQQA